MNRIARMIVGSGRRRSKLARGVAAASAALVVLLVVAVLLPPVRTAAFRRALSFAGSQVAGDLTWTRAAWPGLGRLELDGAAWTDGPDTLLAVESAVVDVSVRHLIRRDLLLRDLVVLGVQADLSGLRAAMPPRDPAAVETPRRPPSFPRPGSWPPAPSVTLEGARLTWRRITIDPSTIITGGAATVRADLGAGRRPWAAVDTFRIAAHGLEVATRAAATFGDSIEVALAPLDVAVAGSDRSAGALTGRAVLAGNDLRVEGLTVTGALGEMRCDVSHRPDQLAADLEIRWPEAPAALLDRAGIEATTWPAGTAPGLDARVRLAPTQAGALPDSGIVDLAFRLPGPRHLAALLPPDLRVDDLGELAGAATVLLNADRTWRARVDLGETDWLDTARLAADGSATGVRVDTVLIALPGLRASAKGAVTADHLDLSARIDLPDATLPARLAALPQDLDLAAGLDLTVTGARAAPEISLDLEGELAMAELSVPRIEASVLASAETLTVRLSAPAGLNTPGLELDGMSVTGSAGGIAAAAAHLAFSATAGGDDLAARIAGMVAGGPDRGARLDTLMIAFGGEDLAARGPTWLRHDQAANAWRVDGLDWAGSLGSLTADGVLAPDTLGLDATVDVRLPLRLVRELAPAAALPGNDLTEAVCAGSLSLGGTPSAPRLDGDLTAGLRGDDRFDALAVALDLGIAGPRGAGATAGLRLDLDGRALASAELSVPATVSLDPPAFVLSDVDSFRLALSTVPIRLADLARYLPPGPALDGRLESNLVVAGLGGAATLNGGVSATDLRVDLDDGTWLEAGGRFVLGGTTRRPAVTGNVTIAGGLVVIPDVPAAVLPARGDAMLRSDAGGAENAGHGTPPADDPAAPPPLDLDVTLDCPGNLWLRGRGLAVELAGDLRITQAGGEPVVVGQLAVVAGSLQFMGRNFEVERGEVAFYGDPAADPVLDIGLVTRLDGAIYRISLAGPALAPTLGLASEPEMAEGDIIASLIFGKPFDQLDEGQGDLLRERTAQVLASLGAMELSDRLSSTVGADLIRYDQGDGDRASSLMVGKYLSPRALLEYEQLLDRSNAFYVRLDYTLSRAFRLETSVGQGTASGVELKWAKDY